jgi:hypothetical protein
MLEELPEVYSNNPAVLYRQQQTRLREFAGMPSRHARNYDSQGRVKIAKVSPHQHYVEMQQRASANSGGVIFK